MRIIPFKFSLSIALIILILMSCQQANNNMSNPPIAKKQPTVFEEHGNKRVDNYYWLNERENEEVIDYLQAENAYTKEILKKTEINLIILLYKHRTK